MSPVTLDRTLAQGLLVLMHRVYSGEVVPPGQWRLFMTDLEKALTAQPEQPACPNCGQWQHPDLRTGGHADCLNECVRRGLAPRTHEDAPGATQEPEGRQPLTLAGAIALVANPALYPDASAFADDDCGPSLCSACREAPRLPDRDFCGPCQAELDADLAELHDRRQSGHPGSRCTAACGHCGACG